MAKTMVYDEEAHKKILEGVNKLDKAVSLTLGPAGKNVAIDEYGTIHSTKDGVTVAKSITLKDKFENIGANAIKEVAEKSNTNVGDGTTTSVLLAAAIYRAGLKYVAMGGNATQLKRGILAAAKHAEEFVSAATKKIESEEDIKRVATVSANGDDEIGSTIAKVMSELGKDGTIKVENSQMASLTSKIVKGMVVDTTYISPYMVTKEDTMEAELDNPFILIANKKLSNIQELLPCLQSVSQTGRSLLIIADDYQDDILATLVMNKLRGFNCVAIKSPSYGANRTKMLNDIATLCGGAVVCDETGVKLESATAGSMILGSAKRIVCNKENTAIIDGLGDQAKIEELVTSLRAQIENEKADYERDNLKERLAKLTSGIGIISVGGTTEAEMKDKRDLVDDAFCASKAALKSGVVAGGGAALLEAKQHLDSFAFEADVNDDYMNGFKIFTSALDAPVKKLLENAGIQNSASLIDKVIEKNAGKIIYGYDILSHEIVDMLESKIFDPTDVILNEIKNASSIAGLLLTTDCLICEEDAKPQMAACPSQMA